MKYREIKVLDEGSGPEGDGTGKEYKYNSAHPFWKHLPGERRALGITYASITIQGASQGGDDTAIKAFTPSLFYVSAGLTGPAFTVAFKGNLPPISRLKHDRVCLFDTGFQLFIWAGKDAPLQDRSSSFMSAQAYLKRWKRPSVLPITRFNDGKESSAFLENFGPPESPSCYGCCCCVS